MPWANLDDQFPKHPKVVAFTDSAFRLHVAGICYCSQYLTDGYIDSFVVSLLVPRFRPKALAELLDRGIWIERPPGYEIHDYLQWNRSRESVLEERERKSKAGRKGAENRWHKP